MLWRQAYQTKVLRDLDCPVTQTVSLDGSSIQPTVEVIIGGFGFDCLAEQTVWWKLFQSDFPGDPHVRRAFIVGSVLSSDIELAQSLMPPSEAKRSYFLEDPNQFWRELIEPDHPGRGFTAIIDQGKILLLMIGPPTEDAWEEFSNAWQART